jgi:Ni/Fe-hydrogenase subunit HybB-like protein
VIRTLGRGMTLVGLLYLAAKVGELFWAGEWTLLTLDNPNALLWSSELLIGVVLPLVLWWGVGWQRRPYVQWLAPVLVVIGIGLNRFDATLFGQHFLGNAVYSPHILEWLSTLGILAAAGLGWYVGVRYLVAGNAKQ